MDSDEDYACDDYEDRDGEDTDDDQREDGDNDDEIFNGMADDFSSLTLEEDSHCQVITRDSLLAAQREDLQRVMNVLSLKEHQVRTLLMYYRWDVDHVFAVFAEKGEEKLFSDAGIMFQYNTSSYSSSHMICEVCLEEIAATETSTMGCGHYFCNDCWTRHFVVKIQEGQSRLISCMAYKCHALVDEEKIRDLVGARDLAILLRFEQSLLDSYVEDNKRVKWCPSAPHCGNAIRIDNDDTCEVECGCGVQFCFRCTSEPHSPCSCYMWGLWKDKCMAKESKSIKWMAVSTQRCPNCGKPVEKNEGCNLVTCYCGQPFCWLCGGPTGTRHSDTGIAGHKCKLYKQDLMKEPKHRRADQDRFYHYLERYKTHSDSLKVELNMKKDLEARVCKLKKGSLQVGSSWLTNGFSRLLQSRRIISYTYPLAFYIFEIEGIITVTRGDIVIKPKMFEEHQKQLEVNIDKLSVFMKEPIEHMSPEAIKEVRMEVIILSQLTDDLCQKLYTFIDDLVHPVQSTPHFIAPYRSEGMEKAMKLGDKD